ncbi:unnamed protein product, partial [Toxocara canis]|uniref:Uncharacterized protein n=1 Tax=Toxocara canis TaxID=6265 RepID=A0A183VGT6_TOXCA
MRSAQLVSVEKRRARADIPPGALELARSFRVFHKLMVTSREIFKKANASIALPKGSPLNSGSSSARGAQTSLFITGATSQPKNPVGLTNITSAPLPQLQKSGLISAPPNEPSMKEDEDENSESTTTTASSTTRGGVEPSPAVNEERKPYLVRGVLFSVYDISSGSEISYFGYSPTWFGMYLGVVVHG